MAESEKDLEEVVKKIISVNPEIVIRALLEKHFWPQSIKINEHYRRFGDDNNGSLKVFFSNDGDGRVDVESLKDPKEPFDSHRFRTGFGGGDSLMVRNALLVLALAIKAENARRPQDRKK